MIVSRRILTGSDQMLGLLLINEENEKDLGRASLSSPSLLSTGSLAVMIDMKITTIEGPKELTSCLILLG